MSYLGIGSPIPVSRIVSSDSVLLSYSSDESCQIGNTITPSQALPAGGNFTSVNNTLGSSLNSSNGSITLNASTNTGIHVIKYTVGTAFATFSLDIKVMEDATFTYTGTGSNPILISAGSGSLSPTETSSYPNTNTYTSSPTTPYINSQGVIDTDNLPIGVVYDITRITGGQCSDDLTVKIQTQATSINRVANNFAMSFNGADQYVSAGNPTQLQITGALTVSTWFKILNNNGNEVIVARDAAQQYFRNWSLFIQSGSGIVRVLLRNNTDTGWNPVQSSLAYDDGEWHHAAFVYTPSTSLILYIDGAEVDKNTTSITPSIYNSAVDFTIGAYDPSRGYTNDKWTGDIDEVAVFNKALSLSEIQLIYNATANNPGEAANLFTAGLNNSLVYWNRMGD